MALFAPPSPPPPAWPRARLDRRRVHRHRRRHRDCWDAAEELYAKLPLIGPVLRFLKRRLA